MQHSQLINTESRDLASWLERLWVSGDPADRERLEPTIRTLLDPVQNDDNSLHPNSLDVAETLCSIQVDQTTITAALLSDPYFTQTLELNEISAEYGQPVAKLCENMRKLHFFRECTGTNLEALSEKQQAEQVRRMLLAMVRDVRAVLIKLSWHLQYLRLLSHYEIGEKHLCAAHQTMEIYAPITNRMGISHVKWEMEDLAFRFQEPEKYKSIAKSLQKTRLERENYIQEFQDLIGKILHDADIHAHVYGRPKHIYSIWKKMKRKGVGIAQLYDLRAIRIIVDNVETCYKVLGMIHERWPHIPEEWDDYIANRKPNGYQSIHTVVIGPRGRHVEIQIRTEKMHQFAELGVAAHWRYKEGVGLDPALERVISSLRRLLDNDSNDSEFLEDFHTELFSDRVFVLTPKGRVIDLAKGSTPLDFAYAIHTDIGHRCQGAKVNGIIAPLNYELHNGEQVEILTGKEPNPKMNWLNESLGYVKSARTKQKINHWFHQQDHEKNYQTGKDILEREKHLLNLPKLKAADLVKPFNRQNERDFLIALGRGDISSKQLADTLIRSQTREIRFRKVKKKDTARVSDIVVNGVEDLYTQTAQCCQPVFGDEIIGYITQGRGISVHRTDCSNITHIPEDQQNRLISVSWGISSTDYVADILVSGYNQPGMLRDIADVLARQKINVVSINTRPTHDSQYALMEITIQIGDTLQLADTLERLIQLPSVTDAQRRM
ncbi:MAG: bifunctional (p)ppGpp synthetase/guanosine-3',5'-bis(diphosphate) 3'-pyrophosphohydrolase [Thiolinea sp.]